MEIHRQGIQNKTAETWDSYEPTLLRVLDCIKPRRALEFGSGKSTKTIGERCILDSVEHNHKWFKKFDVKGVCYILETDPKLYPFTTGRFDEYDFIFIDGIEREQCLIEAKRHIDWCNGAVMIHDAERKQYQKGINSFTHVWFEDDGHTAVMTQSDLLATQITVALRVKPFLK